MSQKITKPTKEELQSEYAKEGTTISSLARLYKTSNPTVRSWLIEYEIDRKSHQQASKEANNRHKKSAFPSKEELEENYRTNSILGMRNIYSVGQETIFEWLDFHNIERRTPSESAKIFKEIQWSDIKFSKEFLLSRHDRTKPIMFLAEELNVSYSHIKKLFKEYEIEASRPWRSKSEIELFEWCQSSYPEYEWRSTDKKIINPFEIDIVNHDKKIAIEYCGMYWHGEFFSGKPKDYHFKKFQMCQERGYKLLTIFESDNEEKVKSLLNTIHGKNERIYARNTKISEIDSSTSRKFNEEHHLSNSIGAKHHIGLFHDGALVMVGSFGKSRFNKKIAYECARMTSHSKYTVVGGASKIFKFFIETYKPQSLLTYADLRFGNGNVYEKCGMAFSGYTEPNYWYFHKNNPKQVYSRVKFQKHKLPELLEKFDPNLTEYENMKNNKWDRIWDCGNALYVWSR
jgi:transposase-like protein